MLKGGTKCASLISVFGEGIIYKGGGMYNMKYNLSLGGRGVI